MNDCVTHDSGIITELFILDIKLTNVNNFPFCTDAIFILSLFLDVEGS